MLADPRVDGVRRELRRAVAVPAQPAGRRAGAAELSRTSTTRCARRSAARPSCSSRASSARTAARFDLLRADYTFVNERLARHYGIPNVKGTHFRRVTLGADSPRRGLLGQGSILTVTSYPDRTSPVVRGKWMLENLLGAPPPAPPPNVPPLQADERRRHALDRCASGMAAAPREPGLRELPRADGPARVRARELRRRRPVAHASTNGRAPIDASGVAARRHDVRRARPGCARRCCGTDVVRHDADREADDLRARAAASSTTTCRPCAPSCATAARQRLPRLGARFAAIVRSAPFQMRRADVMIVTKTRAAAPDVPARRRRGAGAAAARRDGAGAGGAVAHAGRPLRRLGFVYMPNGVAMNLTGIDYWTPARPGRNFELSPILTPLEPFRDRMTVVSGLDHNQAEAGDDGANGDHTRGTSSWLTGVVPEAHRGRRRPQRHLGRSDRRRRARQGHAAAVARARDRPELPGRPVREQLQLRLPEHAGVASPTTPLPTENNPRVVFERLFGDGGTTEQRAAQLRRNRSILDSVLEDLKRLERRLGPADRDAGRRVPRRRARGRAAHRGRGARAPTTRCRSSSARAASPSGSTSTSS